MDAESGVGADRTLYTRLNQLLADNQFDEYVEGLCAKF